MKISDEIRQQINAKVEEINNLTNAGKIDEAYTEKDNLKKLRQTLAIEVEKENVEFDNFMKGDIYKIVPNAPQDAAKLRISAFNKLLFNPLRTFPQPLTDEEKKAYFNISGSPGQPAQIESIPAKGGYLVPTEQMETLQIIRKELIALKDYVTVHQVTLPTGSWPVYKEQYGFLDDFVEATQIQEKDFSFEQLDYSVKSHSDLVFVSNEIIADSRIDIVEFTKDQLAKLSVDTENVEIVKKLAPLVTGDSDNGIDEAPVITSLESLNTALYSTLEPRYWAMTKIFTNPDGFTWLRSLTDANNRSIIQPLPTDQLKKSYDNKEIVVFSNDILPNVTGNSKKYAPILIGAMKNFITFFERQGLELALSSEVEFEKNLLAIRVMSRFDVVVTDKDAMTALKVEI